MEQDEDDIHEPVTRVHMFFFYIIIGTWHIVQ